MARRAVRAPVESFDIGDTGTFTVISDDVKITKTGTVQHIQYDGKLRHFIAGSGQRIVTYDVSRPRDVEALVISRYASEGVGLFNV